MTDIIIDFVVNFIRWIYCVILAFIAWFFGGVDGLLQVLIAFSVIDYFTGIIAAALNHELSSRVGFRGIVRKIILFMFVGMAHLLDNYLPGDSGSIRAVVCLFYVVNEGLSIIENADSIGVKIPKVLHNMLAKIHEMTEQNIKTEPVLKQENNEPPKLPDKEILPPINLENGNEAKEVNQEVKKDNHKQNENKKSK